MLIQIGVKLNLWAKVHLTSLRALLIQIGVKPKFRNGLQVDGLRALLIQIGVKRIKQITESC